MIMIESNHSRQQAPEKAEDANVSMSTIRANQAASNKQQE